MKKYHNTTKQEYYEQQYQQLVSGRELIHTIVKNMTHKLDAHIEQASFEDLFDRRSPITQHDCYERLIRVFDQFCFDLSTHPFALRYLYVLVNACEAAVFDADDLEHYLISPGNELPPLENEEQHEIISEQNEAIISSLEHLIEAHCVTNQDRPLISVH